jgi:hypothetical protein
LALHELADEHAYEAELSQCVGVTGYHHWFFLSAMAEAFGMRMRAFVVESGGEILGVAPLLFRRRGVVSTLNYVPVGCIGPVPRAEALRSGRVGEMLRALEPILLRERVVVTRWSFGPGLKLSADQVGLPGFETAQVANYYVPSTMSVPDYLKSLKPKQRAAIKRGEARGMRAGQSTLEEITRWLPARVSGMYARQEVVSNYTLAAAQSMAERLSDDPRVLWRTIRAEDGRVLAVNGSIIGEDRLWGWLLAGEAVPGASPHVAVYWDSIQWSLEHGLACDFGGIPTDGIRDFKVAMGGELELCFMAERVRPQVYKKARALHGRLAYRRAVAGMAR